MPSDGLKKKNLKFESVLFEFIEPIVLLFRSGKSFFVASALPSDTGYVTEYLVVSVSQKFLKRYFREECDLRFLFVSAPHRKYFKLPANLVGDDMVLVVEFDGDITEEMLPDAQFFASSHTKVYSEMSRGDSALETLFIAGNWEMEDFGSFSRKYRDLYAFEDSLNKIKDAGTAAEDRQKISDAFRGNQLTGGGSYVKLFRDLLVNLPRTERYDLKRVEYASPGRIELQGNGKVFDVLEDRVTNLLENAVTLNDKYWRLHKFMSDAKLLDKSRSIQTVSEQISQRIEIDTKVLLSGLDLDIYDTLFRSNNGDVPNTAKVAMAVYRRIKDAAKYFAEGRIAYER